MDDRASRGEHGRQGIQRTHPRVRQGSLQRRTGSLLVCRAVVDGESLAGMAAFTFGQAAEYYIGWVSEAGRKLNVNNFLFWQAALELRRRGCRTFDLGGMRAGSTEGFKTGMGGSEYQLVHNWLSI